MQTPEQVAAQLRSAAEWLDNGYRIKLVVAKDDGMVLTVIGDKCREDQRPLGVEEVEQLRRGRTSRAVVS